MAYGINVFPKALERRDDLKQKLFYKIFYSDNI